MTNFILLHGTGLSPNHFWFPYVKTNLERLGYDVWAPQLPNPDEPNLKEQLPFVLKSNKIKKETVLIGHSAGCPLILSILENINFKVSKVILVSGFYRPLDEDPEPIVQAKYNWKKIKKNCGEFIFINSDNDPWGTHKQVPFMFEKLGGTMIIRHGEGHIGSTTYKQPYKEFPFLLKLIK